MIIVGVRNSAFHCVNVPPVRDGNSHDENEHTGVEMSAQPVADQYGYCVESSTCTTLAISLSVGGRACLSESKFHCNVVCRYGSNRSVVGSERRRDGVDRALFSDVGQPIFAATSHPKT